jgi:hypothetical protein
MQSRGHGGACAGLALLRSPSGHHLEAPAAVTTGAACVLADVGLDPDPDPAAACCPAASAPAAASASRPAALSPSAPTPPLAAETHAARAELPPDPAPDSDPAVVPPPPARSSALVDA